MNGTSVGISAPQRNSFLFLLQCQQDSILLALLWQHSNQQTAKLMKPMIIIPPDLISPEDIEVLRKNDICVVTAKDPARVKFVDPIPAVSNRTQMENAAIKLSRILLNRTWGNWNQSSELKQSDFARIYIDCLIEGTPLDSRGSKEEREQELYDAERAHEISRIAREDARAEAKRKKEEKAAALQKGVK